MATLITAAALIAELSTLTQELLRSDNKTHDRAIGMARNLLIALQDAAPAEQVLRTPELVVEILDHIQDYWDPVHLFALRRVNRVFRDMINTTTRWHHEMALLPKSIHFCDPIIFHTKQIARSRGPNVTHSCMYPFRPVGVIHCWFTRNRRCAQDCECAMVHFELDLEWLEMNQDTTPSDLWKGNLPCENLDASWRQLQFCAFHFALHGMCLIWYKETEWMDCWDEVLWMRDKTGTKRETITLGDVARNLMKITAKGWKKGWHRTTGRLR
ncbi:hypothetical protein Slin14017_G126180 [Septoria linicola]|nr:hypothetical protein Slin14017_G126180 [Septoria linicola]